MKREIIFFPLNFKSNSMEGDSEYTVMSWETSWEGKGVFQVL